MKRGLECLGARACVLVALLATSPQITPREPKLEGGQLPSDPHLLRLITLDKPRPAQNSATPGPPLSLTIHDLHLVDPAVLTALFPPSELPLPNGLTLRRLTDATEAAERINVQAMRVWQKRFEQHVRDPKRVPMPQLYPSLIDRKLDDIR